MEQPKGSDKPVDESVIERLFMALHGYFGNPFLDKFKLGADESGKDRGIENAKRVWLAELRGFTAAEVYGALRRVKDGASPFPPGLPEFAAACKASRRPAVYVDPARALPAPGELRVLQRLTEQRQRYSMRPQGGLATLYSVIATAVGQAGGDEVATLKQLERDVYPRAGSK